jgi:hypothetical protein
MNPFQGLDVPLNANSGVFNHFLFGWCNKNKESIFIFIVDINIWK